MARKLTLDILKTETSSGVALAVAALAALIVANSPWAADYYGWLKSEQTLQLGPLIIRESVSDWIKEGLMAIFFLVVGLEIKWEIFRGELSDPKKLALPVIAAVGGMVAPALVYLAIGGLTGAPMHGWPVPLATDIAFALAVLALVGRGLPPSLRVFLLTLAIVDDLGAIAIIAVLFSEGLHIVPLIWAAVVLGAGALIAQRVRLAAPFWVLGFGLVWWLAMEAGLSTSLSSVAFALIVPLTPRRDDRQTPIKEAIHDLHPYVAFLILPIFAFAKAGVSFAGLGFGQLVSPLVLSIALALFVGKQIGVFGAAWLTARAGLGVRPTDASWMQIYGVSLLCGVGFTMSLFLGVLAFPGAIDSPEQVAVKLGVLGGSVLSAVAGAVALTVGRKGRVGSPVSG